jgi:hypothetical protein
MMMSCSSCYKKTIKRKWSLGVHFRPNILEASSHINESLVIKLKTLAQEFDENVNALKEVSISL